MSTSDAAYKAAYYQRNRQKIIERQKQRYRERNGGLLGLGTHNMSNSPEWNSWHGMRKRCYQDNKGRDRYRIKGISICERWATSFEAFFEDMGRKPTSNHSLERIDNSAGYSKENCRWALPIDQARNRDSCVYVTVDGLRMTVTEAAEKAGISRDTVYNRIRNGWPVEAAITTKPRPRKRKSA